MDQVLQKLKTEESDFTVGDLDERDSASPPDTAQRGERHLESSRDLGLGKTAIQRNLHFRRHFP